MIQFTDSPLFLEQKIGNNLNVLQERIVKLWYIHTLEYRERGTLFMSVHTDLQTQH